MRFILNCQVRRRARAAAAVFQGERGQWAWCHRAQLGHRACLCLAPVGQTAHGGWGALGYSGTPGHRGSQARSRLTPRPQQPE